MKIQDSILEPGQETLVSLRLDEVRNELATMVAPGAMEAALVERFRATRASASRPRLWWMPPLALAATIAIASWVIRGPVPPGDDIVVLAGPALERETSPFLALRSLERIASERGSKVVATEFPRALLADWGLPVSPGRAAEPVRAEMLYSAEGEPLAVRLLD
jgi:hypothetical protein